MKTVKTIVIVTLHMGAGGAERVFSELASEWINMGIEVFIIQTRPNTGGDNYTFSEHVNVIDMKYSAGGLRRTKQAIELVKLLKKMDDAIVISFMPQAKLLVGMASFFVKNKIVFTERNDPARSPAKKIHRCVRNLIYELADICVFQTEEAKNYFSKRIQRHGSIIPNPIHPELPEPYLGVRKKTVVTAARLEVQKNLPMLIDAFAMFHRTHPDYMLEIYGRGPLEEELREQIKERGIEKNAHLMGFSNNIYSVMHECAMYVSTSDFEGISNSMLEAMGLGLPTICTDCPVGGARETIKNNVNGILIPLNDRQALYEAMSKIADNPDFASLLSKRAIGVREKCSVKRIAEEWISVIANNNSSI